MWSAIEDWPLKLKIKNTSWQMLLYAQVQPVRRPAYVVTATNTCIFIYNQIVMVGRYHIFTHWDECSTSQKNYSHNSWEITLANYRGDAFGKFLTPRTYIRPTQINRALVIGVPFSPIKLIQNILDNAIQNRQWISLFRLGGPDEFDFIIKKVLGRNHKGTMDKSLN